MNTIRRILAVAALAVMMAGVLIPTTAEATALSAMRTTKSRNLLLVRQYLMKASTTIYSGGMVMLNTSGTLEPAAASATAKKVVGIALATKTSAASGNYYVEVQEGSFLLEGTTLSQSDVGSFVYAEDDQTVDNATGSNEIVAGVLVQYVSASSGWVYLSSTIGDGESLTGGNAGTIDNQTNGSWAITEAGETLSLDYSSNLVDIDASGTGASVTVTSTGTILLLNAGISAGWTAPTGANTACATTCAGTGACIIGMNTGGTFVDCADATADSCICSGPSS